MMLLFVAVAGIIKANNFMGFGTMLVAHTTFNLPYVLLSVAPRFTQLDKSLSEAAQDLGCTPARAFFSVELPEIIPGIVSGLMLGIGLLDVILNLTPIIIIAIVIALGLLFAPNVAVKIFSILGVAMKVIITVGLALGIVRFLTGIEVIKGLATIEEGAAVCLNAALVMTGAFPLIYIISRLLKRPIQRVGRAAQINEVSAVGFVSTLATSVTTFGMMDDMDKKGILLNSAFAVSAAFTFAGHMAFTMAFPGSDGAYIGAMIAGKLISGVFALALAVIIHKRQTPKAQNEAVQVIENT
jgi:ethanolamine transporter